MHSELNGRLRNTNLPYSKGLMPVYEAVINSIEAIEDRSLIEQIPLSRYYIKLEIKRAEQLDLEPKRGPRPEGDIIGFQVTDNGVGFNDNNWESFKTLDSSHKAEKGCRGIGRLMWLKAFNNVLVDSTYEENGEKKRRKFGFDVLNEVSESAATSRGSGEFFTVVELEGFKNQFATATHKTPEKIASGLLEHCLWYFIREEGVPQITVCDDAGSIDLFELFDAHMHTSSSHETVELKTCSFDITHVRIRVARNKPHTLGYCASGRLVREENLTGKIPGLYRAITDNDGQFTYMAYLTSDYLDEHVTNERVHFNIAETTEGLFGEAEISFNDIRAAVFPCIAEYLEASLQGILSEGRERVENIYCDKGAEV